MLSSPAAPMMPRRRTLLVARSSPFSRLWCASYALRARNVSRIVVALWIWLAPTEQSQGQRAVAAAASTTQGARVIGFARHTYLFGVVQAFHVVLLLGHALVWRFGLGVALLEVLPVPETAGRACCVRKSEKRGSEKGRWQDRSPVSVRLCKGRERVCRQA